MPAGAVLSTTRGLVHEIRARVGLCSPGCLRAPPPFRTCLGLALPASVATHPQFPSSAEPPDNHPTGGGLDLTLWGNLGDSPQSITPPGWWPGPPYGAIVAPWRTPTNYTALAGLVPVCVIQWSSKWLFCCSVVSSICMLHLYFIDVLPQLLLSMCHR